jgi:TIR domain
MAHDVFTSYSAKDKATADGVCATLEAKGIRCWIAPRDILPGMDWGEAIIEAIHTSRVMILVFSSNANDSNQIKREVERAVSGGIPIIPLRIENVAPARSLEYFIGPVHWLDALTPSLENHLQNLAETVRLLLARLDKAKEGGSGAGALQGSATVDSAPKNDMAAVEQQRLNAEFERLKASLTEQMARDLFTEARATVAAMLRMRPADRETLDAKAVIEDRLRRASPQPTPTKFRTAAIIVGLLCAVGLGAGVYTWWPPAFPSVGQGMKPAGKDGSATVQAEHGVKAVERDSPAIARAATGEKESPPPTGMRNRPRSTITRGRPI